MVLQVVVLVVGWMLAAARAAPAARRDFEAMEERRKRAGRMFGRGATQADVARELEESRQSVSRWHAEWRAGGAKALKGAGRAGRRPRLTRSQLARIDRALRQGPRAHGFPTDVWTLARVAAVIEAETGVVYHPGHVWKLLGRLGWTRQRPARRTVERDDEAIARWVAEAWPRIKRGPAGAERGSSSKTSRGSHSSHR
ncbi:MAG: winged helix-turn-helix domain-containing protein [Acidimicrobiales bacterium]